MHTTGTASGEVNRRRELMETKAERCKTVCGPSTTELHKGLLS
jgi:hypothetical protein